MEEPRLRNPYLFLLTQVGKGHSPFFSFGMKHFLRRLRQAVLRYCSDKF